MNRTIKSYLLYSQFSISHAKRTMPFCRYEWPAIDKLIHIIFSFSKLKMLKVKRKDPLLL